MWLKIKVWTKIVLAAALVLYALLFIYNNSGKQVDFWWWFGKPTQASVFTLSFLAFVSGVVGAILVRTTWKTYAQIRELQRRSRTMRVERDLAEMKSKAGMLKQRGASAATSSSARGFPVEPASPDAAAADDEIA